MGKKIVHKIEPGMNPQDILCTTYQMRNMYKQLHDGFFTDLDVMNYIQHHQIVNRIKKGNRVLDVCCGRGLLLPLLRYLKKDIASYTGVDINPKCGEFRTRRVTDGKGVDKDYYPFPVNFINSNVDSMSEKCPIRLRS
jgi:ubiquinone/menaquinone biosynthesis C-methylase UbiE